MIFMGGGECVKMNMYYIWRQTPILKTNTHNLNYLDRDKHLIVWIALKTWYSCTIVEQQAGLLTLFLMTGCQAAHNGSSSGGGREARTPIYVWKAAHCTVLQLTPGGQYWIKMFQQVRATQLQMLGQGKQIPLDWRYGGPTGIYLVPNVV